MRLSDEAPARPEGGRLAILGIAGSLREASLNRRLLLAAADQAAPCMSVSVFPDLASVPLFNEDLETGNGPPGVARLRSSLAAADGLLIATPEYNQSMPGVLKNAIDWLSRSDPDLLAGKPIGLLGVTVGPWGTRLAQGALRHTLTACGALVMPSPQIYLRGGGELLSADGLGEPAARRQLAEFLAAFGEWTATFRRSGAGVRGAGVVR